MDFFRSKNFARIVIILLVSWALFMLMGCKTVADPSLSARGERRTIICHGNDSCDYKADGHYWVKLKFRGKTFNAYADSTEKDGIKRYFLMFKDGSYWHLFDLTKFEYDYIIEHSCRR